MISHIILKITNKYIKIQLGLKQIHEQIYAHSLHLNIHILDKFPPVKKRRQIYWTSMSTEANNRQKKHNKNVNTDPTTNSWHGRDLHFGISLSRWWRRRCGDAIDARDRRDGRTTQSSLAADLLWAIVLLGGGGRDYGVTSVQRRYCSQIIQISSLWRYCGASSHLYTNTVTRLNLYKNASEAENFFIVGIFPFENLDQVIPSRCGPIE